MKSFSCGEVVPDCDARFVAQDEAALLDLVRDHARDDHGMAVVGEDLVAQVRARIRTVGDGA